MKVHSIEEFHKHYSKKLYYFSDIYGRIYISRDMDVAEYNPQDGALSGWHKEVAYEY